MKILKINQINKKGGILIMSKTVKCPKWGCDGVGIPVDTKKKFSFGKTFQTQQRTNL